MSADFTPDLGTYKDLSPFRFWCQKVIPLVYDDSLSYYELLCKVVDYLNKTMEDVGTLNDDVIGLHNAYVQLQAWVNNYFDNLDVQNEIDSKLDRMAEDGTLSAMIADNLKVQSPVFVNSTSQMVDNKTVYVLTSNGHIYSYNGNVFVDTGLVYGVYENAFTPSTIITQNNYEALSISSIIDLEKNKCYGVASNVTEEMVTGLPLYGVDYTITTFRPNFSTGGYTLYIAVYGGSTLTRTFTCFEYSNGMVSPWNEYRSDDKISKGRSIVTAVNHSDLGYNSISDFTENGVYGISSNITEEMITGLPLYGAEATLIVEQPKFNLGTGYTKYTYNFGTANATMSFTCYSYSNGTRSPWEGSGLDRKTVTCGVGGVFRNIQRAINWVEDGGTVLIMPGVYEEQISVTSKTVHLIGSGKGCTVIKDTSGDYRTPPIEIGSGSVQNMTIIETGEGTVEETLYNKTAYCVHVDWNNQENASILLKDLELINYCHACIGVGVRKNFSITIENCTLNTVEELSEARSRGALYIHTYSGSESGSSNVLLKNNIVKSGSDIAITLQRVTSQNVTMDCTLVQNSFVANGIVADSVYVNGNGGAGTFDNAIKKNVLSNGNNISIMN